MSNLSEEQAKLLRNLLILLQDGQTPKTPREKVNLIKKVGTNLNKFKKTKKTPRQKKELQSKGRITISTAVESAVDYGLSTLLDKVVKPAIDWLGEKLPDVIPWIGTKITDFLGWFTNLFTPAITPQLSETDFEVLNLEEDEGLDEMSNEDEWAEEWKRNFFDDQ